jgi:hypothetical protein
MDLIIKKYSSLIRIFPAVFVLFSSFALPQSADLRFVQILNNNTNYKVNIEIKGTPAFMIGTSNISFNFNMNALSTPILDSIYNYSDGMYNLVTVTNPIPGVCSINIELFLTNSGQQVDTSWKKIVCIKFNITNSYGYSGLNFRTISPNRTNIWANDNATIIQQGNFESLDSFLPVENEKSEINNFNLFNNYPNPFNPSTTIKYQLPNSFYVSLKIYDILGREIAVLENGYQNAGIHFVFFSPAEDIVSGIYFYSIKAVSTNGKNDFNDVKKMILLK